MALYYNYDFIRNTTIFSLQEQKELIELSNLCPFSYVKSHTGLSHKFGFDFVFSTAKIEGSTIDRKNTSILLETKLGVSGVPFDEQLLVKNTDKAYKYIIGNKLKVNLTTAQELHFIFANGLILDKKALGAMKTTANYVTGCDYYPLAPSSDLNSEIHSLFTIYDTLNNPFDKALYIHNNIAYLQYFADCNKRVARGMQLVSSLDENITPLYLQDLDNTPIYEEYIDSLIEYYSTGDYNKSKEFYIKNYNLMCKEISNTILEQEISKINFNKNSLIIPKDKKECLEFVKVGKLLGNKLSFAIEINKQTLNKLDNNIIKNKMIYNSLKEYSQNKTKYYARASLKK